VGQLEGFGRSSSLTAGHKLWIRFPHCSSLYGNLDKLVLAVFVVHAVVVVVVMLALTRPRAPDAHRKKAKVKPQMQVLASS